MSAGTRLPEQRDGPDLTLSIGAGAERQALEIIDAMGLRNVAVKDKNESSEIRRKSAGLPTRGAQAIRDAVLGV